MFSEIMKNYIFIINEIKIKLFIKIIVVIHLLVLFEINGDFCICTMYICRINDTDLKFIVILLYYLLAEPD